MTTSEPVGTPMPPPAAETLIHAAERVLRFLKIDEGQGGGLLSIETIKAADLMRQAIAREKAMAAKPEMTT